MAFDTFDHSALIARLYKEIGVSGKAYRWLVIYSTVRKQAVLICAVKSAHWEPLLVGTSRLHTCVPVIYHLHGSTWKNPPFWAIHFHFYADDSQMCVSFNISEADPACKIVEEAVSIIKNRIVENFHRLNKDMTGVLLIASRTNYSMQIVHMYFII